jgi:glutathione S-transferase
MALAELDQPFQFHALDWDAGDFTAPWFLALNPKAQVPALKTPEGMITETAAILLALSERHAALAPQPQDGFGERAAFLSAFFFVTNTLHPAAMALLHPERPAGQDASRAVAVATHQKLLRALSYLEGIAAEGHHWFSPKDPSILTLYLVVLLRWIKAFPAYPDHSIASADYPHLHGIAKAIENRPRIRAVLLAEGLDGAVFSDPPCTA